MAMAMLEAGGVSILTDGHREADPSNPKGYFEYERVKDLDKPVDQTWLGDARGKAVKIISFLLTHLPESYDYQVIFMQRDLGEVLASQNTMLERRGESVGTDDARMRVLYQEHLEQVARFMRTRRCFSSLDLPYDGVVADPHGHARRIATFLGGRLDVARMASVADRSLYRNRRQPSR